MQGYKGRRLRLIWYQFGPIFGQAHDVLLRAGRYSEECLMPIMLTETAANEIKKIIQEQNLPADQTRLRVGVKGGGCSGFSYMLDLTEEPKGEMDEELESHGVKILVDMKSYLYL